MGNDPSARHDLKNDAIDSKLCGTGGWTFVGTTDLRMKYLMPISRYKAIFRAIFRKFRIQDCALWNLESLTVLKRNKPLPFRNIGIWG